MGCFQERPKLEEEQLAQFAELQFGLSHRSTKELLPALFTLPVHIYKPDLKEVKRHLKLSDLHLSPEAAEDFYKNFEKEEDKSRYERWKFGVLVLLLSNDVNLWKAEMLYQLCDGHMNVNRENVAKRLEFAFLLSSYAIPVTLSESVTSRFPKTNLRNYINNLERKRANALQLALESIFSGAEVVTREAFVKAFKGTLIERCLLSKGIREYIGSTGEDNKLGNESSAPT
jgi:hypothetical protein